MFNRKIPIKINILGIEYKIKLTKDFPLKTKDEEENEDWLGRCMQMEHTIYLRQSTDIDNERLWRALFHEIYHVISYETYIGFIRDNNEDEEIMAQTIGNAYFGVYKQLTEDNNVWSRFIQLHKNKL